jgi:hypothetical protein
VRKRESQNHVNAVLPVGVTGGPGHFGQVRRDELRTRAARRLGASSGPREARRADDGLNAGISEWCTVRNTVLVMEPKGSELPLRPGMTLIFFTHPSRPATPLFLM